jgi:hypothetical protein
VFLPKKLPPDTPVVSKSYPYNTFLTLLTPLLLFLEKSPWSLFGHHPFLEITMVTFCHHTTFRKSLWSLFATTPLSESHHTTFRKSSHHFSESHHTTFRKSRDHFVIATLRVAMITLSAVTCDQLFIITSTLILDQKVE